MDTHKCIEVPISARKPIDGLPKNQVHFGPLGADSILVSRAGKKDQKEKVRNREAFGRVLVCCGLKTPILPGSKVQVSHLITNLKHARSRILYASLLHTSFVLINHNVFSKFG